MITLAEILPLAFADIAAEEIIEKDFFRIDNVIEIENNYDLRLKVKKRDPEK